MGIVELAASPARPLRGGGLLGPMTPPVDRIRGEWYRGAAAQDREAAPPPRAPASCWAGSCPLRAEARFQIPDRSYCWMSILNDCVRPRGAALSAALRRLRHRLAPGETDPVCTLCRATAPLPATGARSDNPGAAACRDLASPFERAFALPLSSCTAASCGAIHGFKYRRGAWRTARSPPRVVRHRLRAGGLHDDVDLRDPGAAASAQTVHGAATTSRRHRRGNRARSWAGGSDRRSVGRRPHTTREFRRSGPRPRRAERATSRERLRRAASRALAGRHCALVRRV